MRNTMKELGEILKKRRELLRLLQPQLSDLSGISVRTIQLIEQGTGNPGLETLTKICECLGLEINLTLKGSENILRT